MNYIIILAGGIGSRFWPLSRQMQPKQFLNLCSSKPMIDECLENISGLVGLDKVYVATNSLHGKKIGQCLNKFAIPRENILLEPQGKNTLAPIALLTQRIYSHDKKAKIIILPCDHFVADKGRFIKKLKRGLKLTDNGYILTLGFTPKRPETGYGYIKAGLGRRDYYLVDKFVEKPDIKTARRYLKDKRYYWNAGIFIFRADAFLDELKVIKPQVYRIIANIKNENGMRRYWKGLPNISIDYAIMEKTKKAALLPADYGWIDLGSWQAIEEIAKKDRSGNILRGRCLDLGSRNILSWSDDRLVATVGLKDIIIVDTKDALLVCAKDKAQEVKKLVCRLKQGNYERQI